MNHVTQKLETGMIPFKNTTLKPIYQNLHIKQIQITLTERSVKSFKERLHTPHSWAKINSQEANTFEELFENNFKPNTVEQECQVYEVNNGKE